MRYKISLFLVFSLFFVLTGCASSTIEYNGTVYNRSDLSEETIVWLEKYNSIPEEDRGVLTYVPLELGGLESIEEIDETIRKNLVGKVYAIEEHYIVIGSDVIYTGIVPEKLSCDVEVGDIVEIEYNMINSKTENKIKLISISKITSSLNHIDFIYDTMISLWEKEDKINENVNSVVLNLSELTNITNTEKSYIATKFSENYDVEVIEMFTNGSTLNEDALTDWFNSGLIIEVNLLEIKETGYLFNIRKYRTGYDDVVIENIEFLKPVEVETEVVEENLIEATNNNTGVPVMEAPVDEIPKNIEDTTENISTEIVSTDTVSTEMETEQIVEVKENIEVNTEIEVTIDEN